MGLKFLHPHVETKIYDNSAVVEYASGAGTALFMPFIGTKGKDNVIDTYSNLGVFLKEFGNPNFKKHGQAIYQAINWLNGGGILYGMRLAAPDATYSVSILNVGTKVKADCPIYKKNADGTFNLDVNGDKQLLDVPETEKGVEVKVSIDTLTNVTSLDVVKAALESYAAQDGDGFDNHPIMAVVSAGRGKYGNNLSFRIAPNNSLDDTYNFRLYDYSIMETNSNGSLEIVDDSITTSLFPEALSVGNSSLFIDAMAKKYHDNVNLVFSESVYESLLDDLAAAVDDAGTTPDPVKNTNEIDFLFGINKLTGEEYEHVLLTVDSVNLNTLQGVKLESGSDGAFDIANQVPTSDTDPTPIDNTPALIAAAKEKMYVQAYLGSVDGGVQNKKKFPIDVVLDANFSTAIKEAMTTLVQNRYDIHAFIDCGITASAADALSFRANEYQTSDYNASLYAHDFMVYDPYISQEIPVTISYLLAQKIPTHDRMHGVHYPIAGPFRGILSGFKSISWVPNELEREDLYKQRINYIEQDKKSTRIMAQNTTQLRTSALTATNNVRVLKKIVRAAETIAEDYYFEFASTSTLSNFSTNLNRVLSEWVNNGACSVCSATVYQTAYDKDMKTARVKIDIVFNNVIERIVIEVNVGK